MNIHIEHLIASRVLTTNEKELANIKYEKTIQHSIDKLLLDAVEEENKNLRAQLNKAVFKVLQLEQEEKRMKWLFAQLLDDLPIKRDWLNPDYEKEMKFYVNAR